MKERGKPGFWITRLTHPVWAALRFICEPNAFARKLSFEQPNLCFILCARFHFSPV